MKIFAFFVTLCLTLWSLEVIGADNLVHDFRGFDDTILYDIDWTEEQEFVSIVKNYTGITKINLSSFFFILESGFGG